MPNLPINTKFFGFEIGVRNLWWAVAVGVVVYLDLNNNGRRDVHVIFLDNGGFVTVTEPFDVTDAAGNVRHYDSNGVASGVLAGSAQAWQRSPHSLDLATAGVRIKSQSKHNLPEQAQ